MRHQPKSRATSSLPSVGAKEVDLLVRYRDGDAAAFQLLVAQYRERLLQFFYRLCWDRDRAEDLAQDLFLKLMLGAKAYRPEGRMTTFIYRVATNLWIDHYRQQRPRRRIHSFDQALLPLDEGFAPDLPAPDLAPPQLASDAEEKAALRAALERLTEPHRLVFELAVYQELPYAEISALLDIPVGTVKSRMHNATIALKELLAAPKHDATRDAGVRRGGLA